MDFSRLSMDNLSVYCDLLLVTSIVLGAITSARIALFLGRRWKLNDTPNGWFMAFGAAAAAIVIYHVGLIAMIVGGPLYGVALIFASVGATGLAWAYIVAGTRAMEQILVGLEKKVRL